MRTASRRYDQKTGLQPATPFLELVLCSHPSRSLSGSTAAEQSPGNQTRVPGLSSTPELAQKRTYGIRSSGVQELQEFRSLGFRWRQENLECEEEHAEDTQRQNTGTQRGRQPHPVKASHRPEANMRSRQSFPTLALSPELPNS
jgi:hypothetical protein